MPALSLRALGFLTAAASVATALAKGIRANAEQLPMGAVSPLVLGLFLASAALAAAGAAASLSQHGAGVAGTPAAKGLTSAQGEGAVYPRLLGRACMGCRPPELAAEKLCLASATKETPGISGTPDHPPAAAQEGGAESDPVRWSFVPSGGVLRSHAVGCQDTELAAVRVYQMYRPTHDRARDKAGDYPSSWHLQGRRRTWEIRLQVRFKKAPRGRVCIGVEYTTYVRLSLAMRKVAEVIYGSIRKIVGDLYYSFGDDPDKAGSAEAEPSCIALQLSAADQFIVSEVGKEPGIDSDLTGQGITRSGQISAFMKAVDAAMGPGAISTDKVYTLSFWSISRLVDILAWEAAVPGAFRIDLCKIVGPLPVIMSMYELQDTEGDATGAKDARHLRSRRAYYWRFAVWNDARPPRPEKLHEALELQRVGHDESPMRRTSSSRFYEYLESSLACCTGARARDA